MNRPLPKTLRAYYPFESHYFPLENGQRIHYLDEGRGNLTLFLHDIPFWSFYYRNLIQTLKPQFRCVAMDYLGFGLSDKPANYDYSLESMIENTIALLKHLNVGKFNLIMHGWGGVPGIAIAERWPERVNRMVLLNANCFNHFNLPFEYLVYNLSGIGPLLINGLNWPVLRQALGTPLGSHSRRGYRFPYSSWKSRQPIRTFIKNLPSSPEDDSWQLLKTLAEKLHILTYKKVLAPWGMKDPLFDGKILDQWKQEFESIKIHEFHDSGHNALEEDFDLMLPLIRAFLVGGIEVKLPKI